MTDAQLGYLIVAMGLFIWMAAGSIKRQLELMRKDSEFFMRAHLDELKALNNETSLARMDQQYKRPAA